MAELGPAIPILRGEALFAAGITGTRLGWAMRI
jgi:hypothetical protein